MKIRNGFVSNSSSSSFVVIMKNDKLTKEKLLEIFDVKKSSPLYNFAKDLANWIFNNVKEMDIKQIHNNFVGNYKKLSLTEDEMIKEIVDEYGGIDEEVLNKIKNKEYRYYYGSAASDSGEAIESYLCEFELNIDTDVIKIQSDGGY